MPTPSKNVKLLHGEFGEIRTSQRDQNPASSRRSWNLPRGVSCEPPRTPGSAQGTCPRKRADRSFQKPCPCCGCDEGQEAAQSPFPGQHQQPQGLLEHSVQGTRNSDSTGKCTWRKKELKERRRALGNMGGFGAEARRPPSCSRKGGPDHGLGTVQRSKRAPGPLPIAAGWRGSRSQRFPPLGHSKIDSRKKRLSVFPSTLQARKSHPARPPPTQTPPPLCCHQRGLYNLKKSPCVAQGGLSRPEGAFRRKARNPLAHVSSLPPQGAAGEETRARRKRCGSFDRAREHDGWREQSHTPPGHCASQPGAPGAAAGGAPRSPGRSRTRWTEASPCNRTKPAPRREPGIPS